MPIYKYINKNFFKKWSKDMAYILGFLFADGTITCTKRGTSYVAFHSADQRLLHSMARAMHATQKISRRSERSGYVYRLQIGSKAMVQDLLDCGLVAGKAQQMRLPKISRQLFGDFVRGYFDGDGNVWSGGIHTKRKVGATTISAAFTSASHAFLVDLQIQLQNLGICGGSVYQLKTKNCSRLSFGKADSLKLYEIMYNTGASDTLYLKRKKRVFEGFIQKMRT
jgi:hypothetical protein